MFGQSVSGEYFCNRVKEQSDLAAYMRSGQNVFIYSYRRLGKTSLVKQTMAGLDVKHFTFVFVDMERVSTQAQFVEVYSKALADAMVKVDKLQKIRNLFGVLVPTFEISPQGEVSFEFNLAKKVSSVQRGLEEVMELPKKIATRYKRRVVVIFDEFQEVENIGGATFEKFLRSYIQHHKDVCYIFMGSKTTVMFDMFNDPKRAFYRSSSVFPLKAIPAPELVAHMIKCCRKSGKSISRSLANELVSMAGGLPHYVQMLAWHTWETARGKIAAKHLEQGIKNVLQSQSDLFQTWYEQATLRQRAVYRALAVRQDIFSGQALHDFDLGSASTVQSVLRVLVKKGLINHENNVYALADPFFGLWLKERKV